MYVQGNPVNWTDPSGYSSSFNALGEFSDDCDPVPFPCLGGGCEKQPKTIVNEGLLTKVARPGGSGLSGQEFYDFYNKMWGNPGGWWWYTFGNDGDFSIQDMIAYVMLYELSPLWNRSDISGTVLTSAFAAEALDRFIGQMCKDNWGQTCTDNSIELYINEFADFSQTAKEHATNGEPMKNPFDPTGIWGAFNRLNGFGWMLQASIHIVNERWVTEGKVWNKPYGWGDSRLPKLAPRVGDLNTLYTKEEGKLFWLQEHLIPSGKLYSCLYDGDPTCITEAKERANGA